ncbi:DUF771 domain-containing protein [Liquorilactobacillus satsumensis]|uniref:DUF771 domain-containing protein n=1 Tax=Liquorilactobacillus satsumensis TaxID=259059 RepID=UPI0039E97D56
MPALLNESAIAEIVKERADILMKEYLSNQTVWWNMKTFNDRCGCGKGQAWIVKNILEPYRDEIDINNGGWCRYYHGGRSSYRFLAKEACQWIENHAHQIDWED